MTDRRDTAKSYDAVADEYVAHIYGELRDKPLDRELLDRFADAVRGQGPVCEIGCGPGQVARYLHDRGVEMSGIDLSAGMVERARRLNPGIEFHQGDMAALDAPDGSWAAIVLFYSIIHIARGEVVAVLRELRRTLRPGGLLFLAFHIGSETIHRDEWWGHAVSVDYLLFTTDEMTGYLRQAGFEVEDVRERDPYPDVEHPSRRSYIVARTPAGASQGKPPAPVQ
jgi:SAM-dependent methyltransferase